MTELRWKNVWGKINFSSDTHTHRLLYLHWLSVASLCVSTHGNTTNSFSATVSLDPHLQTCRNVSAFEPRHFNALLTFTSQDAKCPYVTFVAGISQTLDKLAYPHSETQHFVSGWHVCYKPETNQYKLLWLHLNGCDVVLLLLATDSSVYSKHTNG